MKFHEISSGEISEADFNPAIAVGCVANLAAWGAQRVRPTSEATTCNGCLGGTEGQRVSLSTLCTAGRGARLAQRVDSVPADLAAPWHGGGGSVSTP